MPDTNSETLKRLEQQLLKNGKAACPNPICRETIIAEQSQGRAGSNILEYYCQNETCDFHKKRVINISIGKGLVEEVKGAFSNLGKKAIAGIVGVFLVIGATLGNYVPKLLGIHDEEPDEKSEMVLEENKRLQEQIKTLMEKESTNEPVLLEGNVDNKAKDQKIAQLEKRVDSLQNLLNIQPLRPSVLKGMIDEVSDLMKAEDVSNAKKVFEKIYSDQKIKNSFLAPENNALKKQMVERLADSYSPSHNKFTYEYLKKSTSFEFFQNFLMTFTVPAKDIYLGKAFYNFPNYLDEPISFKSSKRYQLVGVKHYLMAARDGRFTVQDAHIISAINNVLELYKLFKYKYPVNEVPDSYITIEQAIEGKKVSVIKSRIDELQNIIDSISEE